MASRILSGRLDEYIFHLVSKGLWSGGCVYAYGFKDAARILLAERHNLEHLECRITKRGDVTDSVTFEVRRLEGGKISVMELE